MIQTNDKQVWNKQMVESLSCIVVYLNKLVCVYNVNALHLVMIFFYLFSEKRIPLKQIHSVMSSIYS